MPVLLTSNIEAYLTVTRVDEIFSHIGILKSPYHYR